MRAEVPIALPPGVVIQANGVRKRFRKYTRRGDYTTVKTSAMNRLFRRKTPERNFLQVLDGIDLEVPRGQALGIIGRNGSGKSTLLKVIAGILKPDEGSVHVAGKLSPLIELGAGFHPDFTGRENIFLNGIVLGMSRAEIQERYAPIVEFAGLGESIDDPVRTYSSGMYMRLGFSIAIHAYPDILLIDEILAVGDQAFSRKCSEWIGGFLNRGRTIVLVSHDLGAVQQWCREVLWLDRGRVRLRGPAQEVILRYEESVEETSSADLTPVPEPAATSEPIGHVDRVAVVSTGSARDDVFRLGDAFSVEIAYHLTEPVPDLVVAIAIRRVDGVCCYGTSSQIEKIALPERTGPVAIACRFRDLSLLDGRYSVDVTLHRRSGELIDQRLGCVPFTFFSNSSEIGVFRPEHEWRVS